MTFFFFFHVFQGGKVGFIPSNCSLPAWCSPGGFFPTLFSLECWFFMEKSMVKLPSNCPKN